MSTNTPQTNNVPDMEPNNYAVILPCEAKDFRDFISGLLGKPQTISKMFVGTFDLNKQEIEGFHHLIMQRLSQQNEAALTQFTATIDYNDESSILLPAKTKLIQSEYSNNLGEYFLWEKAERGLPKKRRKSSSRV